MNPPPVPQNKTSGLAITSLVLGILSLTCCGIFSGIAAIITGHIAHGRIKARIGVDKGAGLALAGLIMGYMSIVIAPIMVALAVPAVTGALVRGQATEAMTRERQICQAIAASEIWPADSGAATAPEFFKILVEKNVLTQEELSRLRVGDFLVGNVSAGDPAQTILIRTKPGRYSKLVVAALRSGDAQIFRSEDKVTDSPPPRDPAYLSE